MSKNKKPKICTHGILVWYKCKKCRRIDDTARRRRKGIKKKKLIKYKHCNLGMHKCNGCFKEYNNSNKRRRQRREYFRRPSVIRHRKKYRREYNKRLEVIKRRRELARANRRRLGITERKAVICEHHIKKWKCKECKRRESRENNKNPKRIKYRHWYYSRPKIKLRVIEYNKNYNKNPKVIKDRKNKVIKNSKREWIHSSFASHRNRGYIIKFTKEELFNYIINIENCEVCGIKLDWQRYNGRGNHGLRASMDNKNCKKIIKTIKDIQILCLNCNGEKGHRTQIQWEKSMKEKLKMKGFVFKKKKDI